MHWWNSLCQKLKALSKSNISWGPRYCKLQAIVSQVAPPNWNDQTWPQRQTLVPPDADLCWLILINDSGCWWHKLKRTQHTHFLGRPFLYSIGKRDVFINLSNFTGLWGCINVPWILSQAEYSTLCEVSRVEQGTKGWPKSNLAVCSRPWPNMLYWPCSSLWFNEYTLDWFK